MPRPTRRIAPPPSERPPKRPTTTPAPLCPALHTLRLVGGRWKIPILYHLLEQGPCRFSTLQRALPDITQKMLTQQLRQLETDGLVSRKVYPQVPPKVEYALTPLGRSLSPIVDAMCHWAHTHGKRCPK